MFTDRPAFRFPISTPVTSMVTYGMRAPLATHFRKATCEEYGCPDFLNGFRATLDESTVDGKFKADYIRGASGRQFTEGHDEHGRTVFTFTPGQMCFSAADHRVRLDRPELYLIRDGDHRGNPTGRRVEVTPQQWLDDSGETFERLRDKLKEG